MGGGRGGGACQDRDACSVVSEEGRGLEGEREEAHAALTVMSDEGRGLEGEEKEQVKINDRRWWPRQRAIGGDCRTQIDEVLDLASWMGLGFRGGWWRHPFLKVDLYRWVTP